MKRLSIAFVVDRFGNRWGGAEAYGVSLMRELSRHHDITVYARDYDPECDLRLPFIQLPTRSWWPSWFRVLRHAVAVRRMTAGRYDIVHSHSNGWAGNVEVLHVTPVRYNWRVRPMSRLKRLGSFISPRVQTYLRLEARRVASRPGHRVVSVSPLIASQFRQAYGESVQSDVIAPGVYCPGPDTRGDRARLRAQLGYGPDDFVGLMVARNPLRKGLETALQAYLDLAPHHKLMVVGGSPASDRAVQALPQYSALRDRLCLVPATSDVHPYYRAADLCLHPTRNDSFGMAPLEAMSHGLPVVLSPMPWCGFADGLRHRTHAWLLDHPDDAGGLAHAIERVSSDPALRDHLIAEGGRIARQHAWSCVAQRYQALYQELLVQDQTAMRGR